MKHGLGPARRVKLLALVLGLGLGYGAPLLAQPLPLAGRWLPDEGGSSTVLTIKDGKLSWREPKTSAPACVRPFVLKKEIPGTVYTNGQGTKFVAGVPGSIPTYLLKLEPGACGSAGDEVRISFPLIYDTNHIELIDYVAGKPAGVRRFHRKK
jgi:hypothetical protein